jgi:murein DD-endopeptidase MepM/ murein hydrolase activator NlpD
VKSAGWGGGYGNLIKLKHNSTYSTNYAHLTRFAKGITAGARVTQGQVIGYVGSTGFSTGPHLHYEIEKNGVKVNPLGLELPAGEPIKSEWKAEFDAQKQALLAELQ